ncbi:hypothetical protein K2173_027927 [Erythroxylum novogranatense]|uniref:Uncharacterized protein n=1 Tax=Erythroxylum novogranatense TaxID=1862640 RepID=A0AAV8U0K5_9ROSI|nr:hypothetical protein K2173_027927 [Erythroxylum novogranatense]
MEVKIVSRECVKPSSPTPDHLRIYKLSLLDQFMMAVYTFRILFYPMTPDGDLTDIEVISRRSQSLKQSLSKTLTRFYPLAGKIRDNLSIDCDDEGAYYVQARVNCSLSEYLKQPDISLMSKFLPGDFSWDDTGEGIHVAMVQETIFSCGGFVLAVYVSHKIVDGTALVAFLKSWSAMARESYDETVYPSFDAPSFFIQNKSYPKDSGLSAFNSSFIRKGTPGITRFVFDASTIANLKARSKSSIVQTPSRVEAVSAFLTKCVLSVFKARVGIDRPTAVGHNVNMRRRATPQFPEFTIGNFPWATIFTTKETGMPDLVIKLREAISRIDGDFVRKLQGNEGWLNLNQIIKDKKSELSGSEFSDGFNHLEFSSWCNFGLYDLDFGYGKPIWATYAGPDKSKASVYNLIVLIDTRTDRGIEAWVCLDEEEIALLEKDEELLSYASVNPSPLNTVLA